MKQRTRRWTCALVVGCLAGGAQAEELISLPGEVYGGFVEAGGRGTLLVTDEERRATALVSLDGRGMQTTVGLPPKRVGRGLTVLGDGRILLRTRDATTMHDRVLHYDIVEIRGDGLETVWSWNSRDAFPEVDPKSLDVSLEFSGDGRAWGMGHGSSFSFGETPSGGLTTRRERFDVGRSLTDIGKWTVFSPGFVYLDSAGPVVVAPWNKGAFIVHFSENASPVVRPILFDNGVEEYSFLWQWEERILWAETSLYWKAYPLSDLGISGMTEEPVWVLGKDNAAPHPKRGVVQVTVADGRYRVEHAWRDPVTEVEERRASAWYSEYPYPDASGRVWGRTPPVGPWANGVFVSADGRHAVVVERRRSGGTSTSYARVLTLRPVAPTAPVEADREAEVAADREWLGNRVQ